jgi:hypothetical protein
MNSAEPTILSRLANQSTNEWRKKLADRKEAEARFDRRLERVTRRAMSQDKEVLARRYAEVVAMLSATKRHARLLGEALVIAQYSAEFHSQMSQSAENITNQFANVIIASRNDRKRGAKVKNDRDPKQAAKDEARKLWLDWQAGKAIYRNQSDFARHVCEKLGLKDAGNVGKWCRHWRSLQSV